VETLLREEAHPFAYPSGQHRTQALPGYHRRYTSTYHTVRRAETADRWNCGVSPMRADPNAETLAG